MAIYATMAMLIQKTYFRDIIGRMFTKISSTTVVEDILLSCIKLKNLYNGNYINNNK